MGPWFGGIKFGGLLMAFKWASFGLPFKPSLVNQTWIIILGERIWPFFLASKVPKEKKIKRKLKRNNFRVLNRV